MTILTIIIRILLIVWCVDIAAREDRSLGFAVIWSALFGIWAVLVYYIIGHR